MLTADDIIRKLRLKPHPEGGHYRETWRAPASRGKRPAGTAIYYLLREGEVSHWHRIDATEIWHWYAGSALQLSLSGDGAAIEHHKLGNDLEAGQHPQLIVPAQCWQSARCMGEWTLAGCTVSPGFEFSGFEMARSGWLPNGA